MNANLKRMAKGRTVLSTDRFLDAGGNREAILVLEQGKVYDIGTHVVLETVRHLWVMVSTESPSGSAVRRKCRFRGAVPMSNEIDKPRYFLSNRAALRFRVAHPGSSET